MKGRDEAQDLYLLRQLGRSYAKLEKGKKNLTIKRVFSQITPETNIDPSDVVEQGADTSLTEIELQT